MYRIPVLIALVAILATLTIGIATGGSSSAHAATVDASEPYAVSEGHSFVRPISPCETAEYMEFAPKCISPVDAFIWLLQRLLDQFRSPPQPEAPPPLPGPTPVPADGQGFSGCLPAYPLGPC